MRNGLLPESNRNKEVAVHQLLSCFPSFRERNCIDVSGNIFPFFSNQKFGISRRKTVHLTMEHGRELSVILGREGPSAKGSIFPQWRVINMAVKRRFHRRLDFFSLLLPWCSHITTASQPLTLIISSNREM